MGLYGDVEATGHYDKTTHRMKVAALLNYLWAQPAHRPAFHSIALDTSRFVGFANGIINHTTSVLTEALARLPVIRDTTRRMADAGAWSALSEEERRAAEAGLDESVNAAKGSLLLANQTTAMLAVLTQDATLRDQLMREELVDRLAAMLAKTLATLAGPRGIELKVDSPEKYHFHPRQLLADVLAAMLHLAPLPRFVTAVAESGLLNDAAVTAKVLAVVQRIAVLPEAPRPADADVCLPAFAGFLDRVRAARASLADEAEVLQDYPEEFADPLLATLMRDPVRAPSGYTYDRACILQHVMNTPSDPFTRQPLRVEDLQPQPELKARIDAWVADKVAAAAQRRAEAAPPREHAPALGPM
jgi:ubiquitin conjugation factor E4 B